MSFIDNIKQRAIENKKNIIFPESTDDRVVLAASKIAEKGFAKSVNLLGDKDSVSEISKRCNVSLDGVNIIDHLNTVKIDEYANIYCELCKQKGHEVTPEDAKEAVKDPLYYGMIMVHQGEMDVLVGGAVNTTANVIRASLRVIGTKTREDVVSSCFIMIVPDCDYGEKGILAFADAGVIPSPNSRQLAKIAITTAETFNLLTGCRAQVAMLSFSSKGSAKHRLIDRVVEATKIAKETDPNLIIDGELQPDAAIVPVVAQRKAPESPVAGKANVLIFPDLNSGNICYKLVERLAKAKAYGPLIQGLVKPISDLSRGCSVDDIVDISAITLARAAAKSSSKN